jgi:hypothetical protein
LELELKLFYITYFLKLRLTFSSRFIITYNYKLLADYFWLELSAKIQPIKYFDVSIKVF